MNSEKPHAVPDDESRPSTPSTAVPDVPLIPVRSADDSDTGWGERPGDSDDDRLLRDVPPHWS